MRTTEKRAALRTILVAQDGYDNLRRQLAALGDIVGVERSRDLDALSLKIGEVLGEAFEEVAMATEEKETRTFEQLQADAKAALVKGPVTP